MEIPGIPELNKTTIEEKKDAEKDQNSLSTRHDVHHHFHVGGLGLAFMGGLLIFAIVLLCDRVASRHQGTYGYGATAPVDNQRVDK